MGIDLTSDPQCRAAAADLRLRGAWHFDEARRRAADEVRVLRHDQRARQQQQAAAAEAVAEQRHAIEHRLRRRRQLRDAEHRLCNSTATQAA